MKSSLRLLVLIPIVILVTIFVINARSKPATKLGAVDGALAPAPTSPNCVHSQDEGEHAIEPFAYADVDPDVAWQALKSAVNQFPRTKLVTDADGYLKLECRTALLRFVDDVEFLNRPAEQCIHVRSASRLGHSDLGANRKRVEKFHEMWRREIDSNQ